jgi:hypothetical protein
VQIVIDARGTCRMVYDEALDLAALGPSTIRRASCVEPTAASTWWADLAPVGGPVLGPFAQRSAALAAEQAWLARHWLLATTVGRSSARCLMG